MSDFIPKPSTSKIGGLGRKAQKLQALREKAAQLNTGEKSRPADSAAAAKPKSNFAGKKPSFQRKAV